MSDGVLSDRVLRFLVFFQIGFTLWFVTLLILGCTMDCWHKDEPMTIDDKEVFFEDGTPVQDEGLTQAGEVWVASSILSMLPLIAGWAIILLETGVRWRAWRHDDV